MVLQGCAQTDSRFGGPARDTYEGIFGPSEADENPTTGARKVTYGVDLQKLDLLTLLDPQARRFDVCKELSRKPESSPRREYRGQEAIQCAFASFYTYVSHCETWTKGEGCARDTVALDHMSLAARDLSLVIRRNKVQDEIIAASENVCRRFKISLNDQITKTNFSLGGIATTFAGLGAIFTDPSTARALSGAAAIVSGVRAEYNQAYLDSLTVQVVTKGIDARRKEILDQINGQRFGPPFLDSSNQFVDLGGENKLRVRFASRPYIPLSPFEKVDVKFEEEFEKKKKVQEAKKAELENLNRNDQAKINEIHAAAKARAVASNAAAATAEAKRQANIAQAITDEEKRKQEAGRLRIELEAIDARLCAGWVSQATKERVLEAARTSVWNATQSAQYNSQENDIAQIKIERAQFLPEREGLAQKLMDLHWRAIAPPMSADAKQCTEESFDIAEDVKKPAPTLDGARRPAVVSDNLTDTELAQVSEYRAAINRRVTEIDGLTKSIEEIDETIGSEFSKIDGLVGLVPLSQYSVELAVADAIRYHSACTITTGLEEAVESVDTQQNPGFDTLRKGLDELISVRQKIETLNDILEADDGTPPAPAQTPEEGGESDD